MRIKLKRNQNSASNFPVLEAGEPLWFKDQLYIGSVGTASAGDGTEGELMQIANANYLYDGFLFPNALTDNDGNRYGAVIIGNQVWLASNYRCKTFSDGTPIAYGGGDPTEFSDTTPYWSYPGNNSDNFDSRGLLYNNAAVLNGANASSANPSGVQGIAPNNWHVPSLAEWQQLNDYVKKNKRYLADPSAVNSTAKALCSRWYWTETTSASNSKTPGYDRKSNNATGLSLRGTGRQTENEFTSVGAFGSYATCTEYNGTNMHSMYLRYNFSYPFIGDSNYIYPKGCSNALRLVSNLTPQEFLTWYRENFNTIQYHTRQKITANSEAFDYNATIDIQDGRYISVEPDSSANTITVNTNVSDGYVFPNAVQDGDGNWYDAVTIGDQVWLTENLRTKHYSDGTTEVAQGAIGTYSSDSALWCIYGNTNYHQKYGKLYNWKAAMGSGSASSSNPSGVHGLAPIGWHIPSKAEFQQLLDYVKSQSRYPSRRSLATSLSGIWTTTSSNAVGTNLTLNNGTGFNAKANGCAYSGYATIDTPTYSTTFITSTEVDGDSSKYYMYSFSYSSGAAAWGGFSSRDKSVYSGIRCVCDLDPIQFRSWYVNQYGGMQHIVKTNTDIVLANDVSSSTASPSLIFSRGNINLPDGNDYIDWWMKVTSSGAFQLTRGLLPYAADTENASSAVNVITATSSSITTPCSVESVGFKVTDHIDSNKGFLRSDGTVDENTYALASAIPTVNNATLTLDGGGGLTVSADPTFTANASANKTITITHPSGSENTSGFYKITTNDTGHVTAASAVTATDITGLVGTHAGGTQVTLNGNGGGANVDVSIYAPVGSGTIGQYLKSNGENAAPTWTSFDTAISEVSTNAVQNQAVGTELVKLWDKKNIRGRLYATVAAEVDPPNYGYYDGYLDSSNAWVMSEGAPTGSHYVIPLTNIRKIGATRYSSSTQQQNAYIAFFKSYTPPTGPDAANAPVHEFSESMQGRIAVNTDAVQWYDVPQDAKYLYVLRRLSSSGDRRPSYLYFTGIGITEYEGTGNGFVKDDGTVDTSTYALASAIPTNVSDLPNDANYIEGPSGSSKEDILTFNNTDGNLANDSGISIRRLWEDKDIASMFGGSSAVYPVQDYYIGSTTNQWAANSTYRSWVIPIDDIRKVTATSNGTNGARIAFLKSYTPPADGNLPSSEYSSVTGFDGLLVFGSSSSVTTKTWKVPSDAKYLYVYAGSTAGYNWKPSSIKVTGIGITEHAGDGTGFIKDDGTIDDNSYIPVASNALGSTTKPVYLSSTSVFSECSTYAGGTAVTLNGTNKAADTASFYAPITSGDAGQYLKSNGSGAPVWVDLPTASTSTAGITIVGASGGAAAYDHNHDSTYVKFDPGTTEQVIKTGVDTFTRGVITLYRTTGDHYTFMGFSNKGSDNNEKYLGGIGFKSTTDPDLYIRHTTDNAIENAAIYTHVWSGANLIGENIFDETDIVSLFGKRYDNRRYYISSTGSWSNSTYYHWAIPLDGVRKVKVKANSSKAAIIAFLASYTPNVGTTTAPSSTFSSESGFGSRLSVAIGDPVEYAVPSDAKFLYVYGGTNSNVDATPEYVKLTGWGITEHRGSGNQYIKANGTLGSISEFATSSHTHGNITNDGKIGSTANLPLITGANGVVTTGSFGNAANTFCEGNDSRLSDARTPNNDSNLVHKDNAETITGLKTFSNGLILNTASSWTSSDRAIPFSQDSASTTIRYVWDNSTTGLTFNPNTGVLKAAKFVKRSPDSSPAVGILLTDGSDIPQSTFLTSFTETDPTVPAWAKAANKPSYSYSEISNTPTNVSTFTNDAGYLTSFTETDPTVPAWAKAANKPSYSYSEISNTPTDLGDFTNNAGYVKTDRFGTVYVDTDAATKAKKANVSFDYTLRTGNTFILYLKNTNSNTAATLNINSTGAKSVRINGAAPTSSNWAAGTYLCYYDGTYYQMYTAKNPYNYNDLDNQPTIPTVPTNVSAFTNDAGYLTSFTETDPTVPAWAKASTKPSYTLDEVLDGTSRKLLVLGDSSTTAAAGNHAHDGVYQPVGNYLTAESNGFGKVSVAAQSTGTSNLSGTTTAKTLNSDSAADTLNIATGNKWIQIKAEGTAAASTADTDKLTFGHIVPGVATTGGSLQKFNYDEAGHITAVSTPTASDLTGIIGNSYSTTDTNYYPSGVSWIGGGANGPTGTITIAGGGTDVSIPAIPAASASASGVITTGDQEIAGIKKFKNDVWLYSASGASPALVFQRGDSTKLYDWRLSTSSDGIFKIDVSKNTSSFTNIVSANADAGITVSNVTGLNAPRFVKVGGTVDQILLANGDNVAAGTADYYLKANGAGNAPTWAPFPTIPSVPSGAVFTDEKVTPESDATSTAYPMLLANNSSTPTTNGKPKYSANLSATGTGDIVFTKSSTTGTIQYDGTDKCFKFIFS